MKAALKQMKNKTFYTLISMFFLIFFIGIVMIGLSGTQSSGIIRAKQSDPHPLKSFAVAFPQISSIGKNVKISIYLRDVNGAVLGNRMVKLETDQPTSISPADTQTTNNIGMAQFYVTSDKIGQVKLTAIDQASNVSIVNIPTIEFTQ
jgi:hypothetical protein